MMKTFFSCTLAALVAATAIACFADSAQACTGIRLIAKDGTVIYARTMEFGYSLDSKVIVIPRSFGFTGTTVSGSNGLKWTAKFGAVGMNAYGETGVIDGLNEKGLAGGLFYMPGYADYQAVATEEESQSLAPWELLTWILTSFANVEDARQALATIKVGNVSYPEQGVVPVHYILHDALGKSIVIEYIAGKLNVYDNPVGAITNAPDFDWHLKNLNNYVNLSADNAAPEVFDGLEIRPFGQGSGLLGVPGDFTPPSRFVKAVIMSRSALPGDGGETTVRQAFHVLDSFDIPEGVVRGAEGGTATAELTQWTTAADTRNLKYYFHSHDNRAIRRFDLSKTNLDSKLVETYPLADKSDIDDFTPAANDE